MAEFIISFSCSDGTAIDGNPTHFGQKFTDALTDVSKIEFTCRANASTAGNMKCSIYDSGGSILQSATSTIAGNALTTSWESPGNNVFNFSPACTIPAGGWFAMYKESGTWSANKPDMCRSNTSQVADTNAIKYTSSNEWVEETSQDMNIIVTYQSASTGTRLPPPPLVAYF